MGHVLRHCFVILRNVFDMRSVSTKDKCPASITQSTPAGQFRTVFITNSSIGLVFLLGSLTVQLAPLRQELDGNGIEQGFTRLMNLNRINIFFFRPYIGFRRHLQQNGTECWVEITRNHQSQSVHQCFMFRQRTAFCQCLTVGINGAMIQGLSGLPTGKLIFICRQQSGQFLLAVRIVQGNRRREISQQRRDNRLIDAV